MNARQVLRRFLIVSAASSGLIWSPMPAAEGSEIAAGSYHLTRFGRFKAHDLNNKGEVIGAVYTENHQGFGSSAAIYRSYGERAGAVEAILGPERNQTGGVLLNDRGQAVILDVHAFDDHSLPAVLFWDGSQARPIGHQSLRQGYFEAEAINNAGMVAGANSPEDGFNHHGIWSDGQIKPLDELGYVNGSIYAMNDRGQVVGMGVDFGPDPSAWWGPRFRARLWEDGQIVDLGTLGGDNAVAWDINNAGQVVGGAEGSDGVSRAFLWQDGTMTALDVPGLPGSHARAINSAGDIFGIASNDDGDDVPFIYSNGSFVLLDDLFPPGFDLQDIDYRDFNDLGQILGIGSPDGWEYESFLLTPASLDAPAPISSIPATIPEPTTVAMMCLIGVASLARGAYHKAKGRRGRRGA